MAILKHITLRSTLDYVETCLRTVAQRIGGQLAPVPCTEPKKRRYVLSDPIEGKVKVEVRQTSDEDVVIRCSWLSRNDIATAAQLYMELGEEFGVDVTAWRIHLRNAPLHLDWAELIRKKPDKAAQKTDTLRALEAVLWTDEEIPATMIRASAADSSLPPVEDPTDQRILQLVTDDPDLTDVEISQIVGNMNRQAVNTRRRALQKMGYKVR